MIFIPTFQPPERVKFLNALRDLYCKDFLNLNANGWETKVDEMFLNLELKEEDIEYVDFITSLFYCIIII